MECWDRFLLQSKLEQSLNFFYPCLLDVEEWISPTAGRTDPIRDPIF